MRTHINKNGIKMIVCSLAFSLMLLFGVNSVMADDTTEIIPNGIKIGDIDISGLTREEALQRTNDYANTFTSKNIELDVDGNKVNVTAGQLGYYWDNTQVIEEAVSYCKQGNVITRYKEEKDLEQKGVQYNFEFSVNKDMLTNAINEYCGKYNVPHKNASLSRVNGAFSISAEATGRIIDMDTSVTGLMDFLMNKWDKNDSTYKITVVDDNPTSTTADCAKVKDLIGTYTTKFSTGAGKANRNGNMQNGVELINGTTVSMGETFSANALLEPWTESNGWKPAGTYVNGKTVDSLGGGICQVSTTLYIAILKSELEIVERHSHSMVVGYVPISMDAALAGTWKDFKFKNNTNTPIYIEGIFNPSGTLTFNIYGVETRASDRTVSLQSEITSTSSTSKGTGYKAQLWKRVYVGGVLQSEEVVNKSSYEPSSSHASAGTIGEGDNQQTAEPETEPETLEPETPAPEIPVPETVPQVVEPVPEQQTQPTTTSQEPTTTTEINPTQETPQQTPQATTAAQQNQGN